MCAPSSQRQLLTVCEELDESALQEGARLRYGDASEAERTKVQTHLNNLVRLLEAAKAHSPSGWSQRFSPVTKTAVSDQAQRRALGYHPAEVFASLKQEGEHFLTPSEHEAMLAQRLQRIVKDPVLADLGHETLTGDSDLRPAALYYPKPV